MSLNFLANVTSGDVPLDVSFTATGTSSFISQYWDFGDGFISESINPSHIYSCPGIYDVNLTSKYTHLTPGIHVDDAGYITLTTENNYLNNLRGGNFGFIAVIIPELGNIDLDTLIDAQVGALPDDPVLYYITLPDRIAFYWSGVVQSLDHVFTPNFNITNDWILATNGSSSWSSLNGGVVAADNYNTLIAANTNTLRIGASADDPLNHTGTVAFGFFAILDLSSVTVDATFAQNLSNAIHDIKDSDCYDPEAIRTAIVSLDSNITGVFWKFDEGGYSGDANSLTIKRYKIEDGTVDSVSGGSTSAAGCTGCIICSSSGEVTETIAKTNYIQATQDDPKLPENQCCFGPYNVECIGCTSGSETLFYDSSKSFRSCKSIECYESCINQYGSDFDIIEDYSSDCPECRECYLEHKTQLGRYYSLTITNCEIIITDYYPENDCGSCVEKSENHCFAIQSCENAVDENNPPCRAIFDFDDKIFVVSGEIGNCIAGVDCGDCWQFPSKDLNEPFSFLPESIDLCDSVEESLPNDIVESQEADEDKFEIIWHNSPSDSVGLGVNCFSPILIPSNAIDEGNDSLYKNPDIAILPSGHAVVSYEEINDIGLSKITLSFQHTSVKQRITHWRELGKGTLLNVSLDGNYGTILSYDDVYYKSGLKIGFKNGPFAGKLYTISSIIKHPVIYTISSYNSYNSSLFSDIFLDTINKKIYAVETSSSRNLFNIEYDGSSWSQLLIAQATVVHNLTVDISNSYFYVLRRTNTNYVIERSSFISPTVWETVITYSTNDESIALDLYSGKIYYVIGNNIRSVNADGTGDTSLVVSTDTYIPSIKVYENKVYWSEFNNGIIRKSNIDGSNQETIVDNAAFVPWGIDVAGNYLYWTEYKNNLIRRSHLDGDNPKTLFSTVGSPRNLCVDSTSQKVFWLEGTETNNEIPFDLSNKTLKWSLIIDRPYYEIIFS